MKQVAYYVLFMLMLAALACGVPNVSPESTATLIEPPATLEPTDTPFPTDTPTQLPTATAAVRATESASDVLDELDILLSNSDIPIKDASMNINLMQQVQTKSCQW